MVINKSEPYESGCQIASNIDIQVNRRKAQYFEGTSRSNLTAAEGIRPHEITETIVG